MWEDMVERLGEIELMGAGTQAMTVLQKQSQKGLLGTEHPSTKEKKKNESRTRRLSTGTRNRT
jgi:hypothetical protein